MASRPLSGKGDTGEVRHAAKAIRVPFGKYEITLRLGPGNEFIDVVEVRVSRDFLTHQQKTSSQGYHDVTDLYEG